MIKVLNKKVEEKTTYRVFCEECGAELEYTAEDTYIGALGGREIICPACGEKVFLEEPYGVELDSSNIEFPLHFFAPSDSAVDISDIKIQEWVREYLKRAESDVDEHGYYYTGSGNTMVFVFKYEEEYVVYVTKKYWECSILR